MLDANFNASSRSNSQPNRFGPNEPGAIRAFFCISFISATFRGPPSAHRLKPTEPREPQPGHQDFKSHHLAIDFQNVKICPSDPRAAARSPSSEVRVSAPAARVPRPIEANPRARNLAPSAAARAPRSAVWRTCKGAGSPQTITVKIKQLSLIKKSAILRP